MATLTKTLPAGLVFQSDLPVTTGDVDLDVWGGTVIDLPVHPTTITISYLDLTLAVVTPSVVVVNSHTLTEAGPAATLPGGDDWLPESVSYARGRLILGPKTSTDTYPPQVLETASALGSSGPLVTATTPAVVTADKETIRSAAVPTIHGPPQPSVTLRTLALPTTFPTINTTATGTGMISGTATVTGSVSTRTVQPFLGAGTSSSSASGSMLLFVALAALWAVRGFWR